MEHRHADKDRPFFWFFASGQTRGARCTDGEFDGVDMVDSTAYELTMAKHR